MQLVQNAVKLAPERFDLRRREVELNLEMGDSAKAAERAAILIGGPPLGPELTAADRAVALKLRANAIVRQFADEDQTESVPWQDTADALIAAIAENPSDISLAMELARVYRLRLKEPSLEERIVLADTTVDQLVERNPDSASAWLQRYVYRRSYPRTDDQQPPAAPDDADLEQALQLAIADKGQPHTDVWLVASGREGERNDFAKATEYAQRD